MSIVDTAKMIRKAQQAKSRMSKLQVVGKSKSGKTALMLNGLNEIEEIEFSEELFEADVASLGNIISEEVMQAFKQARKSLEQELASSMDMDSIRELFG